MNPIELQRGIRVPMRDGVGLATDIYLPEAGRRPCPVLLERTPYGRDMSRRVLDARFFAAHGYAVTVQDVRGRFDSDGVWRPFIDDPQDGYDTIEWLGRQPWCNGRVGTMGPSYAGSNQLGAAALNPPSLRAMVVTTGAADAFRATLRHNGAMELRWLCYAFDMAVSSKEALADLALARELAQAARDVSAWLRNPPTELGQTPLRKLPSYERWLIDVLQHTQRDAFWTQRCFAPLDYIDEMADVPTLHIGGWYDSYAGATCELFTRLSQAKRSRQCLIMGPWEHTALEERFAGELDFGMQAIVRQNDFRLAWFDRYLKDIPNEVDNWPAARLFVMGGGTGRRTGLNHIDRGGTWLHAGQFPPEGAEPTTLYLHADRTLQPQRPVGDAAPSRFIFDPANPVPTIGGCVSAAPAYLRPGGYDQRHPPVWFLPDQSRPLAERPDVLCFQTPPLPRPMRIVGPVHVELFVATTAQDTDFTAKLVEVYPPTAEHPHERAINLTDSIVRLSCRDGQDRCEPVRSGGAERITLTLYPTACDVAAGHRLRLDISSSNFPRFDVNPAAKGPAEQTVFHDAVRSSRVTLYVLPA